MATKIATRLSVAKAKGCLALLLLGACSSSSEPRDQNWGSDVGRGFDASIASDASDEASENSDTSVVLDTSVGSDTSDGSDASDTEAMDGGAMNAQDTVDSGAPDAEAQ